MPRKTSDVTETDRGPEDTSRRNFLAATGTGLAALSAAACAVEDPGQSAAASARRSRFLRPGSCRGREGGAYCQCAQSPV